MLEIIELNPNSKQYPKKLKNIQHPPKKLYCIGNLDLLNSNTIAIIGSRNCSIYGEKVAKDFSEKLSFNNITVISGLAKGIDTFAHIGTLKNNAKTIAVLGSGLDNIYPNENIGLYKSIILKGGLIISEYELGTKPLKQNFPARNRIISGLADAVLVIEAKQKSGTKITVDFALEQGKDVFVIPGNIYSKNSEGTNELIKQGAIPVTNYEEILEMLRYKDIGVSPSGKASDSDSDIS